MHGEERPGLRAGFQFVVSVDAGDVGRRVSMRRALPDGKFADALGVLERWSDGVIAVRRRDGSLVEFDAGTLVAGKIVPDPPRRPSRPS